MEHHFCQSGSFDIVEALHMDLWTRVDEGFYQHIVINVPSKGIKIG